MKASLSGVSRDSDQGVYPSGTDGDRRRAVDRVKAQASARVDVPTAPFSFAVLIKESNACTSFCANAWTCACQATDRDPGRVSAVKKMNAWTCALLTTDRDPASVIPGKKSKSVTTVIFTGPTVFF